MNMSNVSKLNVLCNSIVGKVRRGGKRSRVRYNGVPRSKGGRHTGHSSGPCEFVETGGSACDAEGPGVNAKPQGRGVGVLAMHAVGATQKGRGGRGGERERIRGRVGGAPGSTYERGHGHSLRRTKHPV